VYRYFFSNAFLAIFISLALMFGYCRYRFVAARLIILQASHYTEPEIIFVAFRQIFTSKNVSNKSTEWCLM